MNHLPSKRDIIQQLQKEILDMQGFHIAAKSEQSDCGLGIINQSFPNNTFPIAAVHEFISSNPESMAATTGFISGLLGTLKKDNGICIWISSCCYVNPRGLINFGLNPDRIIFIEALSSKEKLWVMEEALKCENISAVIGEIDELSFTESRRLQLAVEKSHVTGFIHRTTSKTNNVACVSRWQIHSAVSVNKDGLPGMGFPQWEVDLLKIRNGKPGKWTVQWTPDGFVIPVPASQSLPVLKKMAI